MTTTAPVASVWAAFANVSRWREVLPDLASAHIEGADELAPGGVIRAVALPDRNLIDMTYAILAAEPERRLTLQSQAEGFSAQTTYDIAADAAGGTLVAVSAVVTPERLRGQIMSTLFRPKFVEQVKLSLQRRADALIELAEKIAREAR